MCCALAMKRSQLSIDCDRIDSNCFSISICATTICQMRMCVSSCARANVTHNLKFESNSAQRAQFGTIREPQIISYRWSIGASDVKLEPWVSAPILSLDSSSPSLLIMGIRVSSLMYLAISANFLASALADWVLKVAPYHCRWAQIWLIWKS